jgi:hypothetical protein
MSLSALPAENADKGRHYEFIKSAVNNTFKIATANRVLALAATPLDVLRAEGGGAAVASGGGPPRVSAVRARVDALLADAEHAASVLQHAGAGGGGGRAPLPQPTAPHPSRPAAVGGGAASTSRPGGGTGGGGRGSAPRRGGRVQLHLQRRLASLQACPLPGSGADSALGWRAVDDRGGEALFRAVALTLPPRGGGCVAAQPARSPAGWRTCSSARD